jgi:hypothetical protein
MTHLISDSSWRRFIYRSFLLQEAFKFYMKSNKGRSMIHTFAETLLGEALVGEGPEIAHIDLVIGPKGSSVEQAFMNALSSPAQGHTPLLAVLEPNLPAKPYTLLVNKVTIKNAAQAILMFGPAQAAVAKEILTKKDAAKHPFA